MAGDATDAPGLYCCLTLHCVCGMLCYLVLHFGEAVSSGITTRCTVESAVLLGGGRSADGGRVWAVRRHGVPECIDQIDLSVRGCTGSVQYRPNAENMP